MTKSEAERAEPGESARNWALLRCRFRISGFGIRISFGFRISDFGFVSSFVIRHSSFSNGMAEEIHSPLLSLIKEQNLIDDLQYEEVVGEYKRSGKPVIQILQDFGVMDLDAILHVIADHLGTQVVSLGDRDLPPQVIQTIPAGTARMYQCMPVGMSDSTLQIIRAIEKYYPEESESVSDILKQLGADKDIAKEVSEVTATDDTAMMEALADAAPIVQFVNLVVMQAVKDRASDIHFEPFETEFRIRYRVDGALYEM